MPKWLIIAIVCGIVLIATIAVFLLILEIADKQMNAKDKKSKIEKQSEFLCYKVMKFMEDQGFTNEDALCVGKNLLHYIVRNNERDHFEKRLSVASPSSLIVGMVEAERMAKNEIAKRYIHGVQDHESS